MRTGVEGGAHVEGGRAEPGILRIGKEGLRRNVVLHLAVLRVLGQPDDFNLAWLPVAHVHPASNGICASGEFPWRTPG